MQSLADAYGVKLKQCSSLQDHDGDKPALHCLLSLPDYSVQPPEQEQTVYLSYRRLIWNNDQDREPLEKIEQLLDGLVSEVIEVQEQYR